MASGISTYLKHALINHVFRTTKHTAAGTLYAALYTAAPNAGGGGTEVTGGSYARVAIPVADSSWDAPSSGATQNAITVTFPTPTGNWGTIVAMGIHDDVSTGNLIAFGDLTVSKSVTSGDGAPSFVIGDLDFSF